jgi:carbon monoxide dehydrogenase subunit G
MKVRRSRVVAAAPDDVWATVGDPYHLPRWWPRVERVELVQGDGFTQLLRTDKGRAIRADFRVVTSRRPELRRWRQEVEGTPFAGILAWSETEIRLEPAGDESTRVTLELEQKLRGMARFGGFMVRRATRRALDGALDGLEALHGP